MMIDVAVIRCISTFNAILIAQHSMVSAVEILESKVDLINTKKLPIIDPAVEEYLITRPLKLIATTDGATAFRNADFVIISTPTDYDPVKH